MEAPWVGLVAVAALTLVLVLVVQVVLLRRTSSRNGGTAPHRQVADAEAAAVRARADEDAARIRSAAEEDAVRTRAAAEETRLRADEAVGLAERTRLEVEGEARALKDEVRELRLDLERREQRLAEREQRVDDMAARAAERERGLDQASAVLERSRSEVADLEARRRLMLERVAGLSADQARADLVREIETEAKRMAVGTVRAIERRAQEEGEARAREIVTTAVQRIASEQSAESTVSLVALPSDDMKGRIIGREGRNIRSFEAVTGVNLIIDDTPGAVLLSCFDPVRREVARRTLEALVLDGRIHPHRIEEVHERAQRDVESSCTRAGEDALAELGVTDLHPELVELLGRLRYRTSYGQNVLAHLVECAQVAGLMAAELGLPVPLLKRCALLHDVGKALSHEAEGSHAAVGAEVARRCGESEDVVHAIAAHHGEVEPRTLEAVLTQAADAVSGGRPGARREALESYVRRLQRLEEIAGAHEGVERVYAMQAGREVRVMVLPDVVDDIAAQVLARDIAKQVEEELTYPGQIRITVVRESRASELAR